MRSRIRIRLPFHEQQRQVALSDSRFIVVAAGRRWGKTYLASCLAWQALLKQKRVLWVAPSGDKAAIGWRYMMRLWSVSRRLGLRVERRLAERRFYYRDGWLAVRSAETVAGQRGESPHLAIIDEAAHLPGLRDLWEQEVRPALGETRGRAIFISTPAGMNYFRDLWEKGQRGEEGWQSFRFPTSGNPIIDPAEIEAMRRDLPELVFRQEVEAEFVHLAGALFKREYFRVAEMTPAPAIARVRYWDLAASPSGDYTVGARLALLEDGGLYLEDIVRGRWEWPEALRIISGTARADGPEVLQGVEASGMQRGMVQMLLREPSLVGIPLKGIEVQGNKVVRACAWLARAEQGKFYLRPAGWNAAFLDEVCSFPEGEHDDQVDAVSGAVQMLSSAGTTLLL